MTRRQAYFGWLKYEFQCLLVDNANEPLRRALRRNYWREAKARAAYKAFHTPTHVFNPAPAPTPPTVPYDLIIGPDHVAFMEYGGPGGEISRAMDWSKEA